MTYIKANMIDNNKNDLISNEEINNAPAVTPGPNAKERFYDKIPLTVKQLNVIIVIIILAIILFLVVGALVGNGIISGPKF
jgi:hypothetical protein